MCVGSATRYARRAQRCPAGKIKRFSIGTNMAGCFGSTRSQADGIIVVFLVGRMEVRTMDLG